MLEDKSTSQSWLCEPCENEFDPRLSTFYSCVLYPVRNIASQQENYHFWSNSLSNSGTNEIADAAAAGDAKQETKQESNPCISPEVLKPIYDHLWAHVKCAIWTPELTFDSNALKPIQNIISIKSWRHKLCEVCKSTDGGCVTCDHCRTSVHAGCTDTKPFFRSMEVIPVSQLGPEKLKAKPTGTLTGEDF